MYLLLAFILATEVIDLEMTSQEKKQTGLYKLSEKERAALQHWVDNNYDKRKAPLQNPPPPAKKPIVQEVIQNGKYVRLSDNSLWQIKPEDTALTQSWVSAVEIVVGKSGDPQYPDKLTNTLTGSSVRAKKATAVDTPQATNPSKPQPGRPNQPAKPGATQPPPPQQPPAKKS